MQSVTTRETPQGGETNKRGFPQSFTSKFTLQWCDSSSVNSIEMADPYIWRVSARRHLTIDTVPVTLLDIHLECDKVEWSSFIVPDPCAVCIFLVLQAMTPWCNCTGAPPDTNKPDRYSMNLNPSCIFVLSRPIQMKNHWSFRTVLSFVIFRTRDEDVVVPLIPKKQRPQKKFWNWNLFPPLLHWTLLNLRWKSQNCELLVQKFVLVAFYS